MDSKKYSLTFPQKNIWLVEKFNENTSINIIVGTVNINNEFDSDMCCKAINNVIKNNDAIRIRIEEENNVPQQYISEYEYEKIQVIDMSKNTQLQIEKYIKDKAIVPFNLLNGKLYDFEVLDYGKGKGAILMRIHHMISDAWSCAKIGSDLISYMENETKLDCAPSYTEYILSEKEYEKSDKYVNDEQFWKEYLNGFNETTSLKDVVSNATTNAKRYSVKLEKNVNNDILTFCKENRVSVYSLFLTALSTYIYRIKDKKDIVLGTPVLNRSNFKEKQMLGMFVSTMPIRIKVEENIGFLELIKQVSSNTMTLFRHQKYPYSKTLEYIHRTTDLKSNLYNIVLSYQNARTSIVSKDKYSTGWAFCSHIQDDLQIHIVDMDDTGILNIDYDYLVDLFSQREIEDLHTRIMAIIKNAISSNPTVDNIEIMSNEEKEKILYDFNNNDKVYPNKTIIELFEEQVHKNPDNIAIVFQDMSMTYSQLNDKVNSLAAFLRKDRKIKPNDIVAIIMNRSFEMIISMLSILKAGGAYLPIDPDFPKDRIEYMIQNSGAKFILTNQTLNIDNNVDYLNINSFIFQKAFNLDKITKLEDIIYIIYTSGTTGKPKGVVIRHENVTNLIYAATDLQNLNDCNVWGAFSTYSFDISILEIFVPLSLGKKIILSNESEQKMPKQMAKLIENNAIEVINMTPTRLRLLMDYDNSNTFKSLKNIMLGGEVFPTEIFNKLRSITKADIYDGYGPTEITVWSSAKKILDEKDINIGKSLTNVKSYILDEKLRPLPINIPGELCIGGKGVASGYHNNTQITNDKFVYFNDEKIYKTGDIAYYNENGDLIYLGRKDLQVKLKGLRVEIEEIENAIKKFPGIMNAIVIVNDNSKLCTYYTSNDLVDEKKLREFLSTCLPVYMVPQLYMKVKKFNLNTLGKIDRSKLPEIKVELERDIVLPKNKIQEEILNIWKKELKIDDISIDDSFIELGGDSLSAIKVATILSQLYNVDLTPKEIFENITIEKLEKAIISTTKKSFRNIPKKQDEYPLTESQKGVIANYYLDPDSIAYNIPVEIVLNSDIDIEKLILSLKEVIENNDTFYTKIQIDGERIFQSIDKSLNYDISNIKTFEKEYQKIKKDFIKPFDMIEGPYFEFKIVETPENKYMLININHIIFDGESMVTFLKQLQDVYDGKNIVKQEISYGQIALLNNELAKSEDYEIAKKFFIDKFSGQLPDNSLPLDKPRKSNRSFKGAKIDAFLDDKIIKQLNKYTQNNGVTINSILLALFNILLSKYMYSEDIILGIATSGRKRKEELDLLGMFVKTVPFRSKIDYNKNTNEYIQTVQKELLETLENDIYSFDSLVKDLNVERNLARNPLFDIMFVYQNEANIEKENNHIYNKINEIEVNSCKFDMVCSITPNNDNIRINIEYCTDLFNKENITRFLHHYVNIIKFFLNNEKSRLSDIDMLSLREKDMILNSFNNTKTVYPEKTTIEFFEENVQKYPDKVAIVYQNRTLTFKELNQRANKIAHYLLKKKVSNGDVIAIVMDKSLDYMTAIIAVLKCNAVYVAITPVLPDERAKYMIENANAKYILTNDRYHRELVELENIYVDQDKLFENEVDTNISLERNIDNMAHIIYTSGTTGKPKGNMITHRGMVRLVVNTNYTDFSSNDVMMSSGSLTFDTSTFDIYGAMIFGMTLHMMQKEDMLNPNIFRQYIKENKVTTSLIPTNIFNQFAEFDPSMFKDMHAIYIGGDVMLPKYANPVYKACPKLKLYNVYGPAENSVICTAILIDKEYRNNIPIGYVTSNNICYVVDKCDNLCPINVPGELYVGGDGIGLGYVNREDLTKEKFTHFKSIPDKIYKTGDLTLWNAKGTIKYIGRIDGQLKIRGQRVEILEIQNRMLQIEGIKEVVLKVIETNAGNQYLIAYYTVRKEVSQKHIQEYLRKYLPVYMLPYRFILLDKMPFNQNNKIDKNLLPEVNLYEDTAIVKPENAQQAKILNVFKTILNNNNVGMDSDFFENGGDSLSVIRLISEFSINGINITYTEAFKYKTPMDIYNMLYRSQRKESISDDLKDYNYKKINRLIAKNHIENKNIKLKKKLGNVLLTGVTGFLGVHVLEKLVDISVEKIYCLVRQKNNVDINTRLNEQLKFFFNKEKAEKILSKVIIVEGDITYKEIFKPSQKLNSMIEDISIVINCAATVKHYGTIEKFMNINVEGVKNLVDFCVENKKEFIQISTLSVSGNLMEGGQIIQKDIEGIVEFDETKLYLGQNLDNVYVYTKFLGERYVYEKIIQNNLKAKIIRVGNLTGRYNDGKFQPNVEENAFANRIKTIVELKVMPENMLDLYLEMTPIDYASDSIIKIAMLDEGYNTFHIFNHNHAMMDFVIDTFKKIGIDIEMISIDKTKEMLKTYINDKDNLNKLNGIIADIDEEGNLQYNTNVIVKSDFTKDILHKLGFKWPEVTQEYFIKYLEYLKEIKFLDY